MKSVCNKKKALRSLCAALSVVMAVTWLPSADLRANAKEASGMAAMAFSDDSVENTLLSLRANVTDSAKKNYFSYSSYSGKQWAVLDAESYINLGSSGDRAEECFYEIYFEGNGISVFANRSHNHGKVRFTVDGEHEEIVDLYASSRQQPASVYQIEGLEEGSHILKAVTMKEKNASSSSVVNQVVSAEITHRPYVGGEPDMGGTICDTNTQYTQNRYDEVAASDKKTARLSAWKNDKAISQLALFSRSCSLTNVSVTASALVGDAGTIGSEHVKTTFIKSVKAYNGGYLGYGDPTRPLPPATSANRSEASDILYQQGGKMDLGYDSLLPVWVEFDIPMDAKEGIYNCTLTAAADGIQEPLTFTYTIEVKDITLPDAGTFKDTFDIELWQYPYSSAEYYNDIEPFSPQHCKIMESSMQIYKDLGGHAITTSIVEEAWSGQTYSEKEIHYPSMVRWEKNGDSFTYDYTDFDAWVEFCKGMGLGDKIVLYSIAPWHGSFTYWEGGQLKYERFIAGNERYNTVWGDFLRDLIRHLEEKGWFDQAYIGIDERGFSAAAFDLIDSIKNSDGESLKTAGAMDGFVNKKDLALRVDDLNVGDSAAAAHPEEFANLLKEREAKGLRTTLYSCTEHKPGNFALSAPVESYWTIINAAKMGTAGFLRWAYDAWVEDPLNDVTHNAFEPGDCFLIYPDHKDAQNPVSKQSVRLARMAEGVRDVNKLMYLERQLPKLSDDIRALYQNITVTAGTARSYLSNDEKIRLSKEMDAFKAGIERITDKYLFETSQKPGIHLLNREEELLVGAKYTIPVRLETDQKDTAIAFRSENPSVASVDAAGKITARRIGSTKITLKAAGYTADLTVTVTARPLTIKNALTDYKLPEAYLSDVEKAPNGSHERHYLGQPDMVMLNDNKTLITVFPVGHGKGKIVMKISYDAGETWEEKEVPSSWLQSYETPTLYKLNMTDGTTKLILISGRPASFGAPTGGWDASLSTDGGETWTEFGKPYCETFADGSRNDTVVAMASLIQLKDENGKDIDKWMGVYHDGASFINYKTYLTFDEEGNQQWTMPVPYLSEYRSVEQSHQICEVGLFRSPDKKRIVGLARSQSHNNPATMFYSDDEGENWSEPVDLPGSLAGERHKAMYDPTDPTGQRLIVSFREIKYDLNNNNQFDGFSDWVAGDWIAWVGTYDQILNREDGMYRILLCEDWANNAKSGDTGYAGIVVQPDGTFILDSYGHWDKDYSQSLPNYNVYNDMCWIKQAKFKLSVFDEQAVPELIAGLEEEIADTPSDSEKGKYTKESFEKMELALKRAKEALTAQTQAECFAALYELRERKAYLEMPQPKPDPILVTGIQLSPASLSFDKLGDKKMLTAAVSPANASNPALAWQSDNAAVASVTQAGEVTALANGTATITAAAADGSGVKASAAVTVEVKAPEEIKKPDQGGTQQPVLPSCVNRAKFAFQKYGIAMGKSVNLMKEIDSLTPMHAQNKELTWKSSNEKIAKVGASTGIVKVTSQKSHVKKTATITAINANGEAVAKVGIQVMGGSVSKLKAKGKKNLTVKAGKSVTLRTQVITKGKKPVNKKLRWTVSDKNIAAVSAKTTASMKVKIQSKAKKGKKVKVTATSLDGTNKKITFTILVK